jgi:hypothetical protein
MFSFAIFLTLFQNRLFTTGAQSTTNKNFFPAETQGRREKTKSGGDEPRPYEKLPFGVGEGFIPSR